MHPSRHGLHGRLDRLRIDHSDAGQRVRAERGGQPVYQVVTGDRDLGGARVVAEVGRDRRYRRIQRAAGVLESISKRSLRCDPVGGERVDDGDVCIPWNVGRHGDGHRCGAVPGHVGRGVDTEIDDGSRLEVITCDIHRVAPVDRAAARAKGRYAGMVDVVDRQVVIAILAYRYRVGTPVGPDVIGGICGGGELDG